MATTADILALLTEMAPPSTGIADDEYGLVAGRLDREVRRAGVCWLPDSRVLAAAIERQLHLLVTHEHPWLSRQVSPWYSLQAPWEEKAAQVQRRRLVEQGDLSLLRVHSPWDAKHDHGTVDSYARWLGIGPVLARGAFTAVYSTGTTHPIRLDELTHRFSSRLPACSPARLFGPTDRSVGRVGIAIGGFGGNQFNIPEEFQALGAEVIVCGDLVEHVALAALELDLPVIETLHSASEEPGMQALLALLQERLPQVDWQFLASGVAAWCR